MSGEGSLGGLGRLVDALRWRFKRQRLAAEAAAVLAESRGLGFPQASTEQPRFLSPKPVADGARAPTPAIADRAPGAVIAASVCTLDHLHFALSLATSLRRHHPEITLHVLVVDGDGTPLPETDGCRFLRGSDVGLFADPYLALKLSAAELCCAAKPVLLLHLAATSGASEIVYLDADIYLFSPMVQLLELAPHWNFVVVPHTVAPMPHPELRWERPTLGQLAWAGAFNAGLFSLHVGPSSVQFLSTWRDLATEPGAFLVSRGAQTEQNAFNWVVAFADDVHVMRERSYNVAYWNLHERSLRWTTDSPDGPLLTVDGKPLVAFHFSGFSPSEPSRLSHGDFRHPVLSDRTLSHLLAFYSGELLAHGQADWSQRPYAFGAFPSGVAIDHRMRELFKEYECELRSELDPFTQEGEAFYCRALLSPAPGTGSLLPLLLAEIYRSRNDLRTLLPEADLLPEPMVRWFSQWGIHEMGYGELFGRHRPVVPKAEGLRLLAGARKRLPEVFEGCERPLGRDRELLIRHLEEAQEGELARSIRDLDFEYYDASTLFVVWRLVRDRPDIRESYPDQLDEDAEAFAAWLRIFGTRLDLLSRNASARFERAARGGALARIFSFLHRHPSLASAWPLALVGVEAHGFARVLLQHLAGSLEYDLDDVVMYLWVMEERPWAGLPLVLELPPNARREPSPLLEEGQDALLEPVLGSRSEFRQALSEYRSRYGALPPAEAAWVRSGCAAATGQRRPGVNQYGYFRSPIGLGSMSHGIARALRGQGVEVRENLLTNLAMADGLQPEDFVRRYDYSLDTNLFVSYPHLEERLLESFPPAQIAGRRNVAYLAWEQREGNPAWAERYRDFEQIWTLSSFAAQGLAQALDREVLVVPCVLDAAELAPARGARPAPAVARPRKQEECIAFLHCCDANSSIERKNPEAVIDAFARAFEPGEPACLWLRVTNAHRWPHRRRLQRLTQLAAASGLDIHLFYDPLSRAELLALFADADAYVSLHRAEGFGLTCAEAMAMGKPTIATAYSGNLDFMDPSNSLLVDFEEVEVRTAEGPFRGGSLWAEPNIDHAAGQMRWVYENRAAATALGERARSDVIAKLHPAAVGAIAAAALGHPG